MVAALTPSLSPAFPLVWTSEQTGTRTVVVTVAGELDRHTSPALRDHLDWWLGCGCERLIVDTADVTFADVGAHDALRAIGERAAALRCRVVLTPTGQALVRLTELMGCPRGVHIEAW
jgi:anti-anti-sigma factor